MIMTMELPLDKMTAAEKLQALEEIWDHLCRTPTEVQVLRAIC